MLTLGWQRDAGVVLAEGVSLANFYLTMDKPEEFVLDTSSGHYSGIRFHVKLQRIMSYHLLQVRKCFRTAVRFLATSLVLY